MLNTSSCPVGFLTAFSFNATDADAQTHAIAHDISKQLPTSVGLASLLLVCSLFVLLFGKRLVRPTLFLVTFVGMTSISFYAVYGLLGLDGARNLDPSVACAFLSFAPLSVGVVAGAIAVCAISLGFALVGAGAGAGVGYTAYAAGLHSIRSPPVGQHDVVFVVALSLGALVGAIVMLRLQTTVLIVATALVGAAGATPAIALLLAHVNPKFLGPVALGGAATKAAGPYVYAQAALFCVLVALGLLVQCRHEQRRAKTGPQATALSNARVPLIAQ